MQQRKDFEIKLLSIVIPSYKQEKTIVKDLSNIIETLNNTEYKYEIIVVIDGEVDATESKIRKLRSKNLKIISYPTNQGKGHAVRTGMLAAKGDVIGFIDAGMDIHPTGFNMLLNHMEWYDADIIVGSKLHPVSRVNYPLYRKILSWGYRQVTKALFGFKVKDTQVGLKFFKRKVVRDVFPRLVVKKYAFDIEILAVSYLLGYTKIYEAPIEINFTENSINKKDMWNVIYHMLWDTGAVFYRLKVLRYYNKQRVVHRS